MKPERVDSGYPIGLAEVPTDYPQSKYHQEVDRLAQQKQGKFSAIVRVALEVLRQELGLRPEEAAQIEAEVLQPYQDLQKKLQHYENALAAAIADSTLGQEDWKDLQYLQQVLKLRDEDIAPIWSRFGVEQPSILQSSVEAIAADDSNLPASTAPVLEDDLRSDCGADYTRLRDLLKAGKWEEADVETHLVMLFVADRDHDDWIRPDELAAFPCVDLGTIDRLWLKYSGGRFGFSVQKQIWLNLGGQVGQHDKEIWQMFGDRVGWCVSRSWLYHDCLTFSLDAPEGHLPSGAWGGAFCGLMVCLFQQQEACQL